MASTRSGLSFGAAVALFVALAVAGVAMSLSAQWVEGTVRQGVLLNLGAALFGSGLTLLLIQAFQWHPQAKAAQPTAAPERSREAATR